MAYCGYAENLMVFIYVVVVMLVLIIILLIIVFLINFHIVVFSLKVFNHGFFSDLEFSLTVWNLLFLIIVLIIRIRVILFSCSYINGLRVRNFLILYLRFIFSILWLIINNNFYWMILGWDGLGVVSFMLIVFYINVERINNGLFTLFQNRLGDVFFVLFIVGIRRLVINLNLVVKIGLLSLIIGACVKRAQFPFNSWLLAAIRAPTPISSLVHSSTLVVAGVYILLQFSYCIIDYLLLIKWLRILTLVIRSFGLLNEIDIKKLIAYSTMSHVALIIYFYRFRLYKIVYFHLNIHAMFKSMMFICFGFVILCSYHRQDKRLVSLLVLNPVVKIIYYFSCMCLAGLPFLRGFFSKDLIIEKIMELNPELFFILILLLFLRVRIYYRLKLISLIRWFNSLVIVEKNYFGLWSVVGIIMVSLLIINVYLRLIFRIRLEFISSKWFIYLLVLIIALLRIITNLNFKIDVYDKSKNFFEIWVCKVNDLEKYIYWNVFLIMGYVRWLSHIKLVLLINWWVLILFVVLF